MPIYKLELPKTLDGIVPVRPDADKPVRLAPDPEKVVAASVPVLGLNVNFELDVLAL